ncbi:MAG: hypothetical protein ACYC6L_01510 [Anaerolineae bacterium]
MSSHELFARDRRDFADSAQRIAWYFGASLLPFEPYSPPGSADTQVGGQQALHGLLTALYRDLYANPTIYGLTALPDLTYNDGEWFKRSPEVGKTRDRNAHIFKVFEVLVDIANAAEPDGDGLALSSGAFSAILAAIMPASISRPKMRQFLTALRWVGLEVSPDASPVRLCAPGQPQLLTVLKAMSTFSSQPDRAQRAFALQRADFTALNPQFTPDVRRLLTVLPPEQAGLAEHILDELKRQGYSYELHLNWYFNSNWAVMFPAPGRLKTASFFWLGFSISYRNPFYIELHNANPYYLLPVVKRKGNDYARWFAETWNHDCNHCNSCKGFKKLAGPFIVEYDGRQRELCGQTWMSARNPTPAMAEEYLKLIALHTEAGS